MDDGVKNTNWRQMDSSEMGGGGGGNRVGAWHFLSSRDFLLRHGRSFQVLGFPKKESFAPHTVGNSFALHILKKSFAPHTVFSFLSPT
jgi:hypothetical protein